MTGGSDSKILKCHIALIRVLHITKCNQINGKYHQQVRLQIPVTYVAVWQDAAIYRPPEHSCTSDKPQKQASVGYKQTQRTVTIPNSAINTCQFNLKIK